MKKFAVAILFVSGCLLVASGCQSENDKYQPTPEQTPQIPIDDSRSGSSESFLPPGPGSE